MLLSQSGDDNWSDESSDLSECASDVALAAAPTHSHYLTSGTHSIKAHLAEPVIKIRVSERVAARQKPNSKEKEAVDNSPPHKRKSPVQSASSRQSCKKPALAKAHQNACAGRTRRKGCSHTVEAAQKRNVEQPNNRARRTAARKSARKKKAPLLKVVAKVDGKRVLNPRNTFQGSVPTATISLSSKAGREHFTKRLMQAGWRIETRANKITYWSPARSSIAFSSMLQIAKTYPHLAP